MKLVIVGSRSLKGNSKVLRFIDEVLDRYLLDLELVASGGADGPDTHVEEACRSRGIPFQREEPYGPEGPRAWATHFKPRNIRLVQLVPGQADHLVAILDRQSDTYGAGWTADEYNRQYRKYGKRAERVYFTPDPA